MNVPVAGLPDPLEQKPLRVLHFVSGGFSGATSVAVDLVSAAVRQRDAMEPLLVLRRKRHMDVARLRKLQQDIPCETVPGWSHAATVLSLVRLCRAFRPDVLVAHGFREHLLGRYAGLMASVPALIHVEHNSRERYSRWSLAQAHWLARRTAKIVGCSEGVRRHLLSLGFPESSTISIPNGIRLEPFAQAADHLFTERAPAVMMAARFAKQKDHVTLLRAVALLRQRGRRVQLALAGGGNARQRNAAERLAGQLGIADQVEFLGFCRDVPERLLSRQICVLSTHYEGMPLALIEGMAAGCVVVGSDVVGVREVIRDGVNGRLVPAADAQALADVLEDLLANPDAAAALARAGMNDARTNYGLDTMTERYERLFGAVAGRTGGPHERAVA